MKKLLFISYAATNSDKVQLIKKELTNHHLFEPLIVADRRKPNDALVKLVTEGINSAYSIIPILTPQSFRTQWINQEIGYAVGQKIPIIPIVESTILDDLKGFVHKQNQCPYTYTARLRLYLRDENKDFMNKFRLLIKDMEEEIKKNANSTDKPNSSIEKAIRLKNKKDLIEKKNGLINSAETVRQLHQLILKNIIEETKLKIEAIQKETNIHFRIDTKADRDLAIIIGAEGYSTSIYWYPISKSSISGSYLYVVFWQGQIVFDLNRLAPSEQKNIIKRGENKYFSIINDDLKLSWTNNREFRSDEIVDTAIDWILKSIEKNYS